MLQSVFRSIALPGLVGVGLVYGVIVYGGYNLLKPTADAKIEMERALSGDISAQKHLAACYSNGQCAELSKAEVIGCAWRQVIDDETGHAPDAQREAEIACSSIDPSLKTVVAEARREIESRMAQMKNRLPRAHKG